jgi:hypothetical protein
VSTQLQLPLDAAHAVDEQLGLFAKTRGMTAAAASTPVTWAEACDAAIELLARRAVPFQAADLIREGLVDEPPHPNQWGPRFGAAARRGVIRQAGAVPSARATVHRSLCRQWIGTSHTAAA